jgi:hypothetical protein
LYIKALETWLLLIRKLNWPYACSRVPEGVTFLVQEAEVKSKARARTQKVKVLSIAIRLNGGVFRDLFFKHSNQFRKNPRPSSSKAYLREAFANKKRPVMLSY